MSVSNDHSQPAEMKGFDLASASRLLRSMSNDRRLSILLLLRSKEMPVGEIAETIKLSQSALSQHLAILRADGLVKTRRQAQSIFYSLKSEAATAVLENLEVLFSGKPLPFTEDNVEHVDFRQQSNISR
ncbi:MAG: ArsR/SmtB family transcription factor [Alphaproteobacteria bacterium]